MVDRRARRHDSTRAEILDAAWGQVRERGLAALSLRDLAEQVGMRPPSLYGYFESKNAIYDALFAEGQRALAEAEPTELPDDPREGFALALRFFVDFCTSDVARYQLLFQRTIPGFEPTPQTYAAAQASLERLAAQLQRYGFDRPGALDLFTAIAAGIASQQISNDPGGDRWIRLIDDAVEMYCDYMLAVKPTPTTPRRKR